MRDAQRQVVSLVDAGDHLRFVDVGCDTGFAVGETAKRTGGKGVFYGVDLTPAMIDRAVEHFPNVASMHFLVANAESIPLDDSSFNVIICTNSFHHYVHPDKAVGEFYRLLAPGGKLYILDPTAVRLPVRIFDVPMRFFEPEHVKLYSSKEFRELFA